MLPGGVVRAGLAVSASRYIGGQAITTAVTGYDGGDRPTGTTTTVPTIPGVVEAGLAGALSTEAAYTSDGSLERTRIYAYRGPAGEYRGIDGEELRYGYDLNGRPEYLTGSGSYVADVLRAPYGQALRYGWGNTWTHAAWQRFAYQPGTGRVSTTWIDREQVPITDDKTATPTMRPATR